MRERERRNTTKHLSQSNIVMLMSNHHTEAGSTDLLIKKMRDKKATPSPSRSVQMGNGVAATERTATT